MKDKERQNMAKLQIGKIRTGMITGETLYHPETNVMLLKKGMRITERMLENSEN